VDRSSMVAVLDELEARGLAERRADPADRRKRSIHLTDEGRTQLQRMRAVARKVGQQSFAALSDEERATLHQLLRKLAGFTD
jgi:DNA-binding MarR family transcriptional regulator